MFKIKTITTYLGFTFILLTSCNNHIDRKHSNNTVDTSIVKTQIAKSKLYEAKETAKTIFEFVEQVDTKKITKNNLT